MDEDPWERPKILKRYIRKTPFTMLLRGQNLVGYRHYAGDVVTLQGIPRDTGLDLLRLLSLGDHLEHIAPKYKNYLDIHTLSMIDTAVLAHQVHGA